MPDEDIRPGEFVVQNRHGDVVQRGEAIEIDTPGGIESILNPAPTLRNGDSLTWVTEMETK